MTSEKYFAVHGHFYQPPRVDPLNGQIPQEYGADPYANWNELIYHQCYLPNTTLRNFEKISFNFGATLSEWIAGYAPETMQSIVQQENRVVQQHGVSNGMAQPYFHVIMPLASPRDRDCLVHWGMREYEQRFGHKPQGMWLPETAVDLPSLQALADHGIQFTILAPWQAKDPALDISQPYQVRLPDGRSVAVFFYNSFLSSEVSFNPAATENADRYVQDWLLPQFDHFRRQGPRLFLAASDGELYGHHQPYRDMFLSHLLDGAVEAAQVVHTFPALWLKEHPVASEAQINENTSWSCHHGIERWRDVCGDAPTATWKAPLRQFLDQLAETIDQVFEEKLDGLVKDPWALRRDYIELLLGSWTMADLMRAHALMDLTGQQMAMLDLLLQAQFERLRMFSSDAWFFYDLDRIEPLNALKYAAHAAFLVRHAAGSDVSSRLMPVLARATSQHSGLCGDMAFLGFTSQFELKYNHA